MTEQIIIEEHKLFLTGSRTSRTVLICPMMSEQLHKAEEHWQRIKALSTAGGAVTEDFLLAAFEVKDWNGELSPWETHIEGIGVFAGKADRMLDLILKRCIPVIREVLDRKDAFERYGADTDQEISGSNVVSDREQPYDGQRKIRLMIGGYSLADCSHYGRCIRRMSFAARPRVPLPYGIPGLRNMRNHTVFRKKARFISVLERKKKKQDNRCYPESVMRRESYMNIINSRKR